MSKLNTKQKIGLGVAALVGLCCAGSTIGYTISGDYKTKPTAASTPSASARVDQLLEDVTPVPATPEVVVAPSTAPARQPAPNTSRATKPSTRPPTPAKTTRPPTRKPSPKPTTPAVQQGVTPGAFCSTQGARGLSKTGKPMVCTTTATDERKRWRAA